MDTPQEVSKKSFYKRWWVWVIGVLLLLFVIGSASNGNQPTTHQTGAQETTAQKQYQQIFTFSGNGAKKSEPFTVTGDRFKIAYDCKGQVGATLCTAFVYKVGNPYPQSVMNSTQATKDETVIYTELAGKGDYYIDANVLGNFTMTVYDYR